MMDVGYLLHAFRNIRCSVVADARGQPGVNVIGHLIHALHDDTLAFPLWNFQELLPDLLFKDVIFEKTATHNKPCDRLFCGGTGHVGDVTAAGAMRRPAADVMVISARSRRSGRRLTQWCSPQPWGSREHGNSKEDAVVRGNAKSGTQP